MTHDQNTAPIGVDVGPDAGRLMKIPDSGRTLEFHGVEIADVTTESSQLPRWTEMKLYKVTDGTGRYVLSVVGRSVVYHAYDPEGTGVFCNAGVRALAETLFDDDGESDAEPCRNCRPPSVDDVPLDLTVSVERDRFSVHVCASAAAVIEKLRNPRTATATTPGVISGPGQRLLDLAMGVDPTMRAAGHAVMHI